MMHTPVIPTESYTQGRRLLDRFDALAPDYEASAKIICSMPPAPKNAQFMSMLKKVVNHFGDAMICIGLGDKPRGRRHSAELIFTNGRTTLDNKRGDNVLRDGLACTLIRVSTSRSKPSLTITVNALTLSRHALGRFLERKGFTAGQDDAAFAALNHSLGHIAKEVYNFRSVLNADARLLTAADEAPVSEGFIRDEGAGGVWVISGVLVEAHFGSNSRSFEAGTTGVIIRTFLAYDAMSAAQEERVARYERVMADQSLSPTERGAALRPRSHDRLLEVCS
jgi:hypothetical protein